MKYLILAAFLFVSCEGKSEFDKKTEESDKASLVHYLHENSQHLTTVYKLEYDGRIYLVNSNGGIVEHKQ